MDIKTMKTTSEPNTCTESTTVNVAQALHLLIDSVIAYDSASLTLHNAHSARTTRLEELRKLGYTCVQSGKALRYNPEAEPAKNELSYKIAREEFTARFLINKPDAKENQIKDRIKQDVASLNLWLKYGKFTSNVGKDKPIIEAEAAALQWEADETQLKVESEKSKAVAKLAAESLQQATKMQAAVKAAQEKAKTSKLEEDKTKVDRLEALRKTAELKAKEDEKTAAQAAKIVEVLKNKVNDSKEKSQITAVKAEVKKATSASTTAGAVDHSASNKISAQAGISKDNMARARVLFDGLKLVEDLSTLKALHDIIRMELIL